MNVVAYARFSSSGQADGTSLDRQIDMANAYALSHGWTITEQINDEGRSAYKARHKNATAGLGRFLRGVDDGQYGEGDVLIVESLDRLSREQPLDALANLTRITSSGVQVDIIDAKLSLKRGEYEANIGSLVQLLVGAAQAHGESKRKSELLTETWKKWREDGVVRNHHPHWMDKTKALIPDRVETVQMIFDFADRGFGRSKTAGELNTKGIRTWGGEKKRKISGDWSPQQVSQILRNRAVTGEAQAFSKGQPVGTIISDYYPQIISIEQFERVNSAPTRKFSEKGSGRQSLTGNIFRGWFNCSCGRPMVLDPKKGRRYMRCSGALKKSCPDAVVGQLRSGMIYDILEEGFLRAVKEMTLIDTSSDQKRALEADLIAAERGLVVAHENTVKLLDMLLEKESAVLRQRFDDEEQKAIELKVEIARLKVEITRKARTLNDEHAEAVDLYEQFLKVDDEAKVELRQRINQALLRIVKSGKMGIGGGHFSVTMNDFTTYFFQHKLRPDAEPRNVAGSKPATDFHWVAARATLDDAAIYQARQLAADGAREKFFMLTDEQFEKARGEAEALLKSVVLTHG